LLDILLITPIISNYLPISMLDKLKFNLCNSSDSPYITKIPAKVSPPRRIYYPYFITSFK